MGVCGLATAGKKRGSEMTMNTEQYREHIEYTFHGFCKTVLYHAAINVYQNLRRKQQHEVSLDYLWELHIEPISENTYFANHNIPIVIIVREETVIMESEILAAALLRLPERMREILFFRFYLGYSDAEIGALFKLCSTTIFRRRKAALRLLKKEMDAVENER